MLFSKISTWSLSLLSIRDVRCPGAPVLIGNVPWATYVMLRDSVDERGWRS
jgi:hypothetical protein